MQGGDSSMCCSTNTEVISFCTNLLSSKKPSKTEYAHLAELAILQFKWNIASQSEISSFSALCIDIITHNTNSLNYVINSLIKSVKPKIGETSDITLLDTKFENIQQYKNYISQLLNKYPNKSSITGKEFRIISELAKNHPSLRFTLNKIIGIYSYTKFNLKSFIISLDNGTSIKLNYPQCLSIITTSSDIWRSKLCDIIVDIHKTFTNSHDLILKSLDENFPHCSFTLESHVSYLKVLILLSHLLCDSRMKIYHIIINKFIIMDSETQNIQFGSTDKSIPLKMDALLSLLLQDIDYLLKNPNFDSKAFVSEMFQILKSNIHTLSTTQSIQYIFLYISSLNPQYTEMLLQVLFSILYDEAQLMDSRIATAGFIASLICRQQLLLDNFIICAFEYLLKFMDKFSHMKEKSIPSNLLKAVFEACIRIIIFHSNSILTSERKHEVLNLFSSIIRGSLSSLLNCNNDLIEKAKKSAMRVNGSDKMIRLLNYSSNNLEKSNIISLRLPFDRCNLVYTRFYLMLNSDPDLASINTGKYISDFNINQDLENRNETDSGVRSNDVSRKRMLKDSSISKDVDELGDLQLLRASLDTNIFKPKNKSQLDYLLLFDAYKYSKRI